MFILQIVTFGIKSRSIPSVKVTFKKSYKNVYVKWSQNRLFFVNVISGIELSNN